MELAKLNYYSYSYSTFEDGAGEVELLPMLLLDIVCGATEVDYYSYSYLTLKVEQLVRFRTFAAD